MNEQMMSERKDRMSLVSITPRTFDDVETAIVMMKERKSIIVYTDKLESVFAQRVMDYLSGAAYALDYEPVEVARGVFMIISGDITVVKNN